MPGRSQGERQALPVLGGLAARIVAARSPADAPQPGHSWARDTIPVAGGTQNRGGSTACRRRLTRAITADTTRVPGEWPLRQAGGFGVGQFRLLRQSSPPSVLPATASLSVLPAIIFLQPCHDGGAGQPDAARV
jgi:hypothetical protein